MNTDTPRLAWATGAIALYALLCVVVWLRHGRRQGAGAGKAGDDEAGWITILHASQSGHAEAIARETARALQAAGRAVRMMALGAAAAEQLVGLKHALIVVSTHGDGNPPDEATGFWSQCIQSGSAPLVQLRYGMLALGDRRYEQFCGFGRALDGWLRGAGAKPLFERIDMDGRDPQALENWRIQIAELAGAAHALDWQAPAYQACTLWAKHVLNAGSMGGTVVQLKFASPPSMTWQSGDLVELLVPGDADHPRSYSIASVPQDGRLELLVRLNTTADGRPGLASGWLVNQLAVGEHVLLRVVTNTGFHLGENAARPIIFIGNGTGLAGLRAHLRARALTGVQTNWLIFGERQAACDFLLESELRGWLASGVLTRLDTAFSRDQPERIHVQTRLREASALVCQWVHEQQAAIYVCGSLEGMGQAVHTLLTEMLGADTLDLLMRDKRYCRDVY